MKELAKLYGESSIRRFLFENFRNDTVMRSRLQNLFDGVREIGRQQGRAEMKKEIKERQKQGQ